MGMSSVLLTNVECRACCRSVERTVQVVERIVGVLICQRATGGYCQPAERGQLCKSYRTEQDYSLCNAACEQQRDVDDDDDDEDDDQGDTSPLAVRHMPDYPKRQASYSSYTRLIAL